MCGIAGILDIEPGLDGGRLVREMTAALRHRGPDDEGYFEGPGIFLGHRRLSILDLSERGHQPMHSADGRYTLIFNGEIYNFKELRAELKGYPFCTGTDTEVILAAWAAWGTACIDRFIGMFAFALWDSEQKCLFLARDRMGIKPLYYAVTGHTLVFSSEIRSLLRSGLVMPVADPDSVINFLMYQTVHAPKTLVTGVNMLMPGYLIEARSGKIDQVQHHSTGSHPKASPFAPFEWENLIPADGVTAEDAKKNIREKLRKAVERRLIADVPLGAFLSGGIDSSAIVGLMAECSSQPVSTFSVVFSEKEYDESRWSEMVARKFKTEHHPILLRPEDFLNDLPQALRTMDHPSGDGINSYIVSRMTREKGIKVALSGLGGDELFAGYPVFTQLPSLSHKKMLWSLPPSIRRLISGPAGAFMGGRKGEKAKELLRIPDASFSSIYPIYRTVFSGDQLVPLISEYDHLDNFLNPVEFLAASLDHPDRKYPGLSKISIAEMRTYTLNVLLRDADQMSMAHGLEVRVPFLDHELVEYVLSLPDHLKQPDYPKKLLVESLNGLLPDEVVHRKKMGFVFPWDHWLKNELKSFCEERLNKLKETTIFAESGIDKVWTQFNQGKGGILWMHAWLLVVLQEWLENNGIRT